METVEYLEPRVPDGHCIRLRTRRLRSSLPELRASVWSRRNRIPHQSLESATVANVNRTSTAKTLCHSYIQVLADLAHFVNLESMWGATFFHPSSGTAGFRVRCAFRVLK